MNQPLQGIKVVDCTFFIAGPSCSRTLADWGADVIKVEPPRGDPSHNSFHVDPRDSAFTIYNLNKKGIVIDGKKEAGASILLELIAEADVFVTSYRTNALVKMGLDYDTLHAKFPRLVWAQVNGFGDEGPDAAAPGFDTVAFWARSGAMNDFVEPEHPVINAPVGFGDFTAGATLAGGVAAALYGRDRTGVGEKVMISLFGQAIYGLGYLLLDTQMDAVYPKSRKKPAVTLMNSFQCKDGKWIFIAILEHERYYGPLMKLIGRDDLVNDERYCSHAAGLENATELIDILDEGFLKYTQAEWTAMLDRADIAYSTIRQTADLIHDPQALANNYIQKVKFHDGSEVYYARSPVQFGSVEPDPVRLAPRFGEDTVEILKDIRYTDEQIGEMIRDGVVTAFEQE